VFGPMYVKYGRARVKRYGVIFTCLASRAVHFEVVHSLDTDSFLGAFSRFVARRGRPKTMYSDRGTNFIAAGKELSNEMGGWKGERLGARLAKSGVEWVFNPPYASHRGGLWERLIRSTKTILRALAGQQLLTDESLLTLMAEAERIMNDRPLVRCSSDPRDPDVLTPAKLLLLRGSSSTPIAEQRSGTPNQRWYRQAQSLADAFWKRWTREYLPMINAQQKWHKRTVDLKAGDIVLIDARPTPRGQWPLAVVVEGKVGRDGLVRSVRLRTGTKEVVRPVTQLCLLEAEPQSAH
jgi:transposase InsO family protein